MTVMWSRKNTNTAAAPPVVDLYTAENAAAYPQLSRHKTGVKIPLFLRAH